MNKVFFSTNFRIFALSILVLVAFFGCIKDDDGSAPSRTLPDLKIDDVVLQEGDIDDTIQIAVTLTGANNTNVVVRYAAVAGAAVPELDYEILSGGQLVFAPGETEKLIKVKVVGDDVRETDEQFEIKLYNPINAVISKDVAAIKITDDDNNTAGLVIPTGGYSTPTSYAGYNLAWADEFDADTLNTQNWTFEAGAGGWGNQELQYYRSDNTSLVDGKLVITAKKQQFGNSDYTSSRLVTKGKKQFKFGRIDIRAALPKGQGLWPALWMLGSNIDAVSWPACGEIDIMELAGNLPTRVVGTVHYGANVPSHQYTSQSYYLPGTANFQDEFHVFSIDWEADRIRFYVDDNLYHTITPSSLNGATYPFNKNFFFIMNVAVGGTFPGNPDATSPFPQSMIVDYIRVFQK